MKNVIHIFLILFLLVAFSLSVVLLVKVKGQQQENQKYVDFLTKSTNQEIMSLNDKLSNKERRLFNQTLETELLSEQLEEEKRSYNKLEDQINQVSKTVGILQRVQKTDKELLAKYSRVYFLNEHYIPTHLKDIKEKYIFGSKTLQIKREVNKFLQDMIEDMKDDGIDIRIVSAYRSFEYQKDLKKRNISYYGQKYADQLVADQGLSEHQLGTTVDFSTPEGSFIKEDSKAYEWLQKRADRYGFILSYPKDNAYYNFEPWH